MNYLKEPAFAATVSNVTMNRAPAEAFLQKIINLWFATILYID